MDTTRPRVLLVEDDALVGHLLKEFLPLHAIDVTWVESGEEGLRLFQKTSFDLVVTDKNLPGMSGLDLLREVRTMTDDVDVIMMTAYADMDSVLKAVEAGVYDYLCKPFDALEDVVQKLRRGLEKRRMLLENRRLLRHLMDANDEIEKMNRSLEAKVAERTEELRLANEQLAALTLTDDVTGLYNQRFLKERLEEEFRRARRHRQGLAVMMLDLDHFKRVNDDHDHVFGSRVLVRVAQALRSTVRQVDLCVRYGGDEFTVILPHTDLQDAVAVAERVRSVIAETDMGDAGATYRVTVSVGVASLSECEAKTPEALLREADRALYSAKDNGRNRVAAIKGRNPIAVVG